MWKHFIALFIMALSLNSCLRPESKLALTCDAMLNYPFHQYIGEFLDTDAAIQIIKKTYGVEEEKISINHYPQINEWNVVVSWKQDGIVYKLYWKRGRLQHLLVEFQKTKPNMQSIMQCIDESPKWYRAIYGPRIERTDLDFLFELWFPAKGIVIQSRGSVSDVEHLPVLDANLKIDYISVVKAGTPSQMYDSLGSSAALLHPEDESAPLVLWPGDWFWIEWKTRWHGKKD